MSAESLTQKWLRQNVLTYPQKDRVYVDIDAALARYPTLRPKSDVYTYDDGRTQLLLCVHGLLPISFRGASYNIPVAIWITREYPRHAPITYVVPTQDLLVKPGKYVDVSGRSNVEYIQQWEKKSEACNLSALLEAMQEHFSREPPLYAKPKDSTLRQALQPTPMQSGSSVSSTVLLPISAPLRQSSNDRPALPPKPGSSASSFLPVRSNSALLYGSNHMLNSHDLAQRPPPQVPQRPPDTRPPQYEHVSASPNYHLAGRVASVSNISRPASTRHPADFTAPQQSNRWSLPPQPSNDPSLAGPVLSPPLSVSFAPQPQYAQPPHLSQQWSPPISVPQPQPQPPPDLLDEETAEPSSSAPQDSTAPPRPPNPELLRLHAQVHSKLNSELASLSQVMSIDAERLRAQQTDLLKGEPAIRDEMARLEAVRDVCQNVAGRMRGVVEQGERNVAELRRKGDPEVDELVCSTTIVHNQLINLVAEDNAIEDTIYHLHRALNAGRIDLERFLRTTRVLAEEQFLKRALTEKIRAGLPMDTSLGFRTMAS